MDKEDEPVSDQVRSMLSNRARSKRSRNATFNIDAPTEWQPRSVLDPRSHDREYFTDESAWEFIADLIEGGIDIKCIELTKPPGKKGYVAVHRDQGGDIYIKLQLASNNVIGRSFHYSKTKRQILENNYER